MHRLIVFALILLSGPVTAHAQENFTTINDFLKATLKGNGQLSTKAEGDLNNDGLPDWVGVIRGENPDSAPTYQLFVLLRVAPGGYRIAENTEKAEIAGMGCCWLEDLQIRRGSIYVQNNAKDASSMEAATHQFKLNNGQWRLIGLRIFLTDYTPNAHFTRDTDMNLLTGLVVDKVQKRGQKSAVTSRHKKFPTYLLKGFDFSNGFGAEDLIR
jgi:hypothetical protein